MPRVVKSPNNSAKRIYNPVTRTYYSIRIKDTSAGNKGSIIGKWHPPKKQ